MTEKHGILVSAAQHQTLWLKRFIGLLESPMRRANSVSDFGRGLQAATARRRVYNKSLRCTKAFFNESGDPIDWQFFSRTRTASRGVCESWRCV